MLQIAHIRKHPEDVIKRLSIRGIDAALLISEVLALDEMARSKRTEMEQLQAKGNLLTQQIGTLYKNKEQAAGDFLKVESIHIKEDLKSMETELEQCEKSLLQLVLTIPNTPCLEVPVGISAEDNKEILQWGAKPILHPGFLPHWDLAAKYQIIDFELGVKITGSGFPVYKGKGAILQRALIHFFLTEAANAGYMEMQVPLLVNAESGFGTGQLPDKEAQMYHVGLDDLYLIPTAEVPITNLYRNVILDEAQLPIKNTGHTACFRREAGSYGAHVRGLNRLHQFDKVEIVQLVQPGGSNEVLEQMQNHVQGLLQKLGLHYRMLLLCGGDMGFTSAKTYDLEVWSAAQEQWLECSSVSNFETFQSNRLKCRFRNSDGKTELVHTLNGSALALPRILAALLENYQTAEGIVIPDVLVPFTGFSHIH
ncbi:MAG: serine--tRNA ligase [Flavobacteriales bacterium]|nr:MAG: serine--tRNA ligase [Flavobacteriales bacterium]